MMARALAHLRVAERNRAAMASSFRARSKISDGYNAHSVSSSPRALAISLLAKRSSVAAITARGTALQSTRAATSASNVSSNINCRVPARAAARAAAFV